MRSGIESIRYFRRAIRGGYKETLDSLLEKAERRRDPALIDLDAMEVLLLPVVLEHEKEIVQLRNRTMGK